jgi:hypothetical protein
MINDEELAKELHTVYRSHDLENCWLSTARRARELLNQDDGVWRFDDGRMLKIGSFAGGAAPGGEYSTLTCHVTYPDGKGYPIEYIRKSPEAEAVLKAAERVAPSDVMYVEAKGCDHAIVPVADFKALRAAVRAYREAQQPKPRYAPYEFEILDLQTGKFLTNVDACYILNREEPVKP